VVQDVHITCRNETLQSFVDALEGQFAGQREEVVVVDYGYSQKCVHGYVVLEWIEEADEVFLAQLDADESVIDYCVYTVPSADDFPFGAELTVPEREQEYPACDTD